MRLKSSEYAAWVFNREGWKALNEKCLYHISRDYESIEVGDVVFVDGHIMNFDCLNPWTGKPKRMTLVMFYDAKSNYPLGWEIAPTENTEAVKIALYRSIMALGKMPRVIYLDNGKAFRSRFFNGVHSVASGHRSFPASRDEDDFRMALPSRNKTGRGFFRIFGELERKNPRPTPALLSKTSRPGTLNRGELQVHRKLYDVLTAGRTPTILEGPPYGNRSGSIPTMGGGPRQDTSRESPRSMFFLPGKVPAYEIKTVCACGS